MHSFFISHRLLVAKMPVEVHKWKQVNRFVEYQLLKGHIELHKDYYTVLTKKIKIRKYTALYKNANGVKYLNETNTDIYTG